MPEESLPKCAERALPAMLGPLRQKAIRTKRITFGPKQTKRDWALTFSTQLARGTHIFLGTLAHPESSLEERIGDEVWFDLSAPTVGGNVSPVGLF